jgi:membrane-bound serine protease (ClpP class)
MKFLIFGLRFLLLFFSFSQLSAVLNPILEENLKDHIQFSAHGPNHVGHILIEDRENGINQSTWLYVKSALDYYKKNKPIFIILELNTPGGEVFAAQKISDALKELDTQYNIPVVCYINNWAISAGAMLAYSCRYISVVKDASMGAAEPVIQGESGQMTTASEKVISALRTDFANRARFFDRNPYIAEAMVDKDIILVMRNHQIIILDNESQIRTNVENPDIIISPKGKLLTLNSEQLMNYGVADILLLPKKLEPITVEERVTGKWPADRSILFQQPFFDSIPQASVDSYRMDWKTNFFVILANPVISSLLFLGLILGFYVEFTTPGFGLAGTVAVTCLFLIVLSSFALDIGNWLELILLLVGIGILLVELFVLPTFGLLGFVGVVFFFIGLFGMMLPEISSVSFDFDSHTWNAAGEEFVKRLSWLCATLLLAFAIIILLARYISPSFSGLNRFVLSGNEQKGFIAGEAPTSLPQPGAKGEVLATLRPAGKVLIGNNIYDAMSSGGFIEKGTPIIVQRLEGSIIIVKNSDPNENLRSL